jgi:hypothetical protein
MAKSKAACVCNQCGDNPRLDGSFRVGRLRW